MGVRLNEFWRENALQIFKAFKDPFATLIEYSDVTNLKSLHRWQCIGMLYYIYTPTFNLVKLKLALLNWMSCTSHLMWYIGIPLLMHRKSAI